MGLILIYDTETSGLFTPQMPSDDPAQPHLVELSAGMYDDETGAPTALFHAIVRPDGWTFAPDAVAKHGITEEHALAAGRPEVDVVNDFLAFQRDAIVRVAHNEYFDARIIRIGVKRYHGADAADDWSERPAYCTAKLSTKTLNLPPTAAMRAKNMNFPKTPTLEECIGHFFHETLGEEAHTAGGDRDGCARVFFHLRKLGLVPEIPAIKPRRRGRFADAAAPATIPTRRASNLAAMESASTPATSDPNPPTDGNEVGFL